MSAPSVRPARVVPLIESHFGLDGGAMFGIIPRPLWSRTNPPDEQNRIAMVSRCLLIEYAPYPHPQLNADRPTYVLVDVGMGSTWKEKERVIYNIHDQDVALANQLSQHRITAEQIDHVILTHLHFDHAGGLSYLDDHGQRHATFPNATHWVQRKNWSWAHGPSMRDAGSYRIDDFGFLGTADNAPTLECIKGPRTILPGIDVYPQNGHTFGMQVVNVQTDDAQIYSFVADLIPTASHLRDPYVMGYDLQPVVTLEEKRTILHEAARHDWIIIYEHDPFQAMSRIEIDQRGRPKAVPID